MSVRRQCPSNGVCSVLLALQRERNQSLKCQRISSKIIPTLLIFHYVKEISISHYGSTCDIQLRFPGLSFRGCEVRVENGDSTANTLIDFSTFGDDGWDTDGAVHAFLHRFTSRRANGSR